MVFCYMRDFCRILCWVCSIVVGSVLKLARSGFAAQLCHLLSITPGASPTTSLCLCFLFCKKECRYVSWSWEALIRSCMLAGTLTAHGVSICSPSSSRPLVIYGQCAVSRKPFGNIFIQLLAQSFQRLVHNHSILSAVTMKALCWDGEFPSF